MFFLIIFARQNINVKQWEKINKEGEYFFLYYVAKVGEFMKLPCACEDINR